VNFSFLPWLLWERWLGKKRAEVDEIYREIGENKVIAELAERDPEMKKALDSIKANTPPRKPPAR